MQNIFDNERFFNSYKELRETDNNYNTLLEQPSMKKLLPDLSNKSVLDLGCGFGINCMDFVNLGASRVTGVDISMRMLDAAYKKNSHEKITYVNMPIENLNELHEKYDIIYSSLCFHYIKDFGKLTVDISNLLNDNGVLLFSQEHPIATASISENLGYLLNSNDSAYAYSFSDYQNETEHRTEHWFVDGVVKYHRTFSTIIDKLIDSGFVIQKVVEPIPDEYALKKREGLIKEFIKPSFLIIKAIKM